MLGFFSRKKKAETCLYLQGISAQVDTYKCLYLAAEKNLSLTVTLSESVDDSRVLSDSPFAKTPVLQEGEQVYAGTAAILPYLDIRGGGQLLTPKKATHLGKQNYWIQVGQQHVLPYLNVLLSEASDVDLLAQAKSHLDHVFGLADKHLEGSRYFAGNYSFAEIHWIPYLHFCHLLGYDAFAKDYPHLNRWYEHNRTRTDNKQKLTIAVFPDQNVLKRYKSRDAA